MDMLIENVIFGSIMELNYVFNIHMHRVENEIQHRIRNSAYPIILLLRAAASFLFRTGVESSSLRT